ncbi:COP1-interactive protein 1-like isoform X2 [Hibiscus syriacus]|uniref:COP1-interactive protein 1-like isoform X1 n=1 Tax=Hibiscus syriacus TaxID=106335 RepID=UPI0019228741|nr:COP1-interactive protein 1-like isoform X1 [Hibiscus syriacus]XP_039062198.1 COP1-interactive protein 1-like isoform X2 [Hibiscus syriacus]
MTRHRFRESIKSFFAYHVDPERDEQLKGSKIEIDENVATILKLIKDEDAEENGVPIANSKKEPLVRLIEDFHEHYQNLYAQYDHLTGELRKKAHGKLDKDSSSSSSSESDSDSSTKNGGSKNGILEREFHAIDEGIKQELEAANLEIADLKRKLADTSEEKDALNSNYLASLSKVQEAEEIITNLKLESERSESEKSKHVVENEELRQKLDTAAKMEAEVNQRLEELHRENSQLIIEKEASVKRIEDGEKLAEDLRREVGLLKEENLTLKQQLESSEQRASGVSQSLNATMEENNSLNSKLSEVSNGIQLAQGTIQRLMAEISQSKADLGDREKELVMLKELHEVHENQSSAKIKEVEAQVTSLELELEQLRTTNRDMELQIENKASEVKQLGEVNIRLQSQISELEMMSKQREEELLTLSKKFEDNEKESMSRVENLTIQISDLVADLESLRTQKAQLEEHIALKSDEASTEVKSLMDQINTLQLEMESLHSQKAELEVQLESKTQAISDYVIEIEKAKEEILIMTEDQQRVLQENEGLLTQTKELELEVNYLRNQKGELEEDLRTKIEEDGQLREENRVLQSQILELEMISKTRHEELSTLTMKFEDNKKESLSRVENLTLQINNMVADMESLRTQKARLEEHIVVKGDEASTQVKSLMDQINTLQQELGSLNDQKAELEVQLERKNQDISDYVIEVEKTKEEIVSKTEDQLRMVQEKEGFLTQINKLEFELNSVKNQKGELEEGLRTKIEEDGKLREENTALQSQISELEMISKQRQEELLILTNNFEDKEKESLSRVENLTMQINNLLVDMELLRTQKAQLEEHIVVKGDETSTQVKSLMDQINTLQQELESLHSQKAELEVQLESKTQVVSDLVIEIEKSKEEIVSKTEDQQRVLLEKEGLLAHTEELESEVNSLKNQKGELEEDLRTKIEENGQLREELVGLQNQIFELEKSLAEKGLEFNALVAQVKNLQQELDSLQTRRNELELQLEREKQESSERLIGFENEKSGLESQISNQQRTLEEQGEAYKKLAEEYKEVEGLYQECKANLELAERKLKELSEEFHINIESKSQVAADMKQIVENLRRVFQAKEYEKNGLVNQIADHQRMLKEQDDAFNKLNEEYKQLENSFGECNATIEFTEKKMQEMAGEHNTSIQSKDEIVAELEQTIEDLKRDVEMKGDELSSLVEKVSNIEVKLRLSNQKLRVTEQLLTENEESYRKAEAKYQEEQRLLEEKVSTLSGIIVTNNEAYSRMIKDISENVNSTLIGFESIIDKFEKGCRNYEHRIEQTSKELKIARRWVEETESEKKRLTNEATNMIGQLKALKEEESTLREQAEKLRIKAHKEEGEKENLVKAVDQLEKKVELLEKMMKEKDQGLLGLGEEKREAIRQLCLWIDYHRSRCDHLKEIMSKTIRVQRTA